ncbi:MAG TPA: peptide ABC transporter substrate-binding protein [Gammaproteobacteria bacterium]|jgi:oligopeptide transport system substrate-binding protein|nr:peptide ABC transporter substrate-binding protein [Gammaproteobacteria bacterium]
MRFRFIWYVSLAVLMTGCGNHETNVESGNRDGILHFGNASEPQGLDPHVVTGIVEHRVMKSLFEGLLSLDPNDLSVIPGAAETWSISEDGLIYTFNLHKNGRWSNGDPVLASDFVWSWWRSLQPALGNQYVFMLFPVKNAERYFNQEVTDFEEVGVKALDDYTLQVELTNPTPYFLQLMDHYSTWPVHRPTIEKFGKPDESYTQWTRPGNLVGNGAFVLTEWKLNRYVAVERNEFYWDTENVKLNGIKYYPTENRTTEERMFRAGQLHFTYETAIDRVPYYRENSPELLQISPYMGSYLYRLNTTLPQLSDVRVRKALAMTIDRQLLIDTVLNGLFTPSYAITPPGLLGYYPPKLFSYDPEQARKLMAEAGYPNGEGFPVTELQYNTDEQHRKVAITIQQMWKKELNIDVTLQNRDWKVYLDNEATGNFEISRGGWIADYVDPNSFLDMWIDDSGLNRTGWSDERYDDLILQQAPTAVDAEARYEIFYEAETLMMESMPFIPIYTYASHHFRDPAVKGAPPNVRDEFNFNYIYLDPTTPPEKYN